jgi:hypothetical protein
MVLFSQETWVLAPLLVPRLRTIGWEMLDAPVVDLDSEGHVVVAPPAVPLDAAALAGVPANRFDGSRPTPGRYRVAAWVVATGIEALPETVAGRVALVSASVQDLNAESAPSSFDTVAAMLQGAAWAVSPSFTPNDLVATLAHALP